uniref:Cathepsin propeptide inhibitor domain-containing protein n=1 Tax=Clastoptera arizonana TaxID=38151 RepID=A0A1B6CHZ6_9HEMI
MMVAVGLIGLFWICVIFQNAASLSENGYKEMFEDFVKTHKRVYPTQSEMEHRYTIFKTNMKKAARLQRHELGTAVYGTNKFSDFTSTEVERLLTNDVTSVSGSGSTSFAATPKGRLPKRFDWRKRNVVTKIKNQQDCTSGWAFAVTGNIESLWAIKHKQLISLSEQELLDCSGAGQACLSAISTEDAYNAVIKLGGLHSEDDYPYVGTDRECTLNQSKIAVNISGVVSLSTDEADMARWLVKHGPIAARINAETMLSYTKGIANPSRWDCLPKINHAVLIVGFGTYKHKRKSLPYWIIKNSWGTSWGEKGYMRMVRGKAMCGLNSEAFSAIL